MSLEQKYNLKPLGIVLTLSTKRLLAFFKAERRRYIRDASGVEEAIWEARLNNIRTELKKREHVPRKVKKQPKIFRGKRIPKFRKASYRMERELALKEDTASKIAEFLMLYRSFK